MRDRASGGPAEPRSASPPRPTRTHIRAPDLVKRNFTATRPDELWVADFTYCSTWSGVVYVAFVIDVFSRRLVGWKAARSMTADPRPRRPRTWRRGPGGTPTSTDSCVTPTPGSQYTSIAYTERLDDVGAAPSIGTVGDSYDNAMAESVMGIFKTELHRNPAALPPTAGPGRASTTSRSPPAPGCRGSTRSGSTPSSTTRRRPSSKPTTVTISGRCGMRDPNKRVSGIPRPVQCHHWSLLLLCLP